MGSPNLLHTKAEKYGNFDISLPPFKGGVFLVSQAEQLLAKEIAFYQSFFPGCSGYKDFIKRLRDLVPEADRQVYAAFMNVNIEKTFKKAGFEFVNELETKFYFEFKQNNPEINILDIIGKIPGMTISGDGVLILSTDLNKAKDLANQLYGRKFQTGNNSRRRFAEFAKDVDLYGGIIQKQLFEGITLTNTKQIEVGSSLLRLKNSAFSYTADDIKGDKILNKEIADAINTVYNFIMGIAGNGTIEMKKAVQNTWNESFKNDDTMRAAFFEKGGYLNYLKGAMGEFQSALLLNYTALKTSNETLKAIIADTLKGEQDKSDVTLIREVGGEIVMGGVQVKNINVYAHNLIEGNIHPDSFFNAISASGISINSSSFKGFLANYFFNTDYEAKHGMAMAQLELVLSDYIGEIMNMAVNDAIADKVTFYLISGEYLVPGSDILFYGDFGKAKVEITSGYDGKSDLQYFEKGRKEGKEGPIFLDWWKPRTGKGNRWQFDPTPENKIDLLFNEITIKTGFFASGNSLGNYLIF